MSAAFDLLADRYDAVWTTSAVGRLQREAVWHALDGLFVRGDSVLDLGCGTGEDALHLMATGVSVSGSDISPAMVKVARARGVKAQILPIEQLDRLDGQFDGALSNFGALNCVARLAPVAEALGRLVRPGGRMALCLMGRCCVWETFHYLRLGAVAKAFRRWRGGADSSIGVRVSYPSVRQVAAAFAPAFRLERWRGIGLLVPPSYVTLDGAKLAWLAAAERRVAGLLLARGMADHRLLIFKRV